MKKNLFSLALFAISASAIAQTGNVGINTTAPKATLDITATDNTTSKIDGLLIPRVSQAKVEAMGSAVPNSTLVYLTAASTNLTGAYALMNEAGFYYYDSATPIWKKLITSNVAAANTAPTGFQRLPNMTSTNFYWNLIGASTNYGTEGLFGLDATWNPADLSQTLANTGGLTYNTLLTFGGLTTSQLGALGQNSFTAGTVNSASNTGAISLGAGNISSGVGSFTAGVLNQASGTYSTAIGYANKASGTGAIAIGNSNTAAGGSSFATGNGSQALVLNSIAMGQSAKVDGGTSNSDSGVAIGSRSYASGNSAIAFGPQTIAKADYAMALGNTSTATGLSSVAMGIGTTASSMYSTAIGAYNTVDASAQPNSYSDLTRRLFVIGNGTGTGATSDAFTVLRNGTVGIGYSNFAGNTNNALLQVNGNTQTQGMVAAIKTVNANYTIGSTDYTIIVNGTNTVTLPAPAAANTGRILVICGASAGSIVSGSLQDTGGTFSSFTFGNGNGGRCITVQSTGSVWWITGRN